MTYFTESLDTHDMHRASYSRLSNFRSPQGLSYQDLFLPWASHGVGWHPGAALPNSDGSGRSHRGRTTVNSGAYRLIQCDGYTATGVYSETSRADDPSCG